MKPFCASSPEAQAMTDDEFWDAVYHTQLVDEADALERMIDEINHETWVIDCVRCGRSVEVDEDTRADRERDAFCDDCSAEHTEPAENESWDYGQVR